MLNLKPLAPGREGYYLRTVASGVEDYYLGNGEAPGSWTGGSAALFGLEGRVGGDDLRAVLAGLDPCTGERLTGRGRGRKRTVPGWDATFRAPKSVSLLWALSDLDVSRQVREAHDRAVAEAIAYLERNAAVVRRRGQQVAVDGFVAAAFRHRTSRTGDPLLHTHVLIANHGLTPDDGQWRTLDGRLLLSHARTAGFVYQAVLRHELTRTLGVAWNPVVNGHADLAGLPRWLIEAFSTRRHQIVQLLDHLGQASAKAAQIATLATRPAKTDDTKAEPGALQQHWKQLAERLGWTAAHLSELLHSTHHEPLNLQQATAIATELAGTLGLTAHLSTFTRRDVVRGWAERLPDGAATAHQLEALADALLDEHAGMTVALTQQPSAGRREVDAVVDALAAGLDADDAAAVRCSAALAEAVAACLPPGGEPEELVAALTARELHSAEDPASVLVWRARQLIPAGALAPAGPGMPGHAVIRLADGTAVAAQPSERRYSTPDLLALEQSLVDRAVARQRAGVGIALPEAVDAAVAARTLTDEQQAMVRRLTSSGAGVEVVVGKAGTGKTYALAAAREAWQASGHRVIGASLAARAAQELTAKAGIDSSTVARLLMADRDQPLLTATTVLVIDEAAMVGTRQLAPLLDAAEQAGAKVVLVGDHHQLPEIDAGGAFRGLLTRLDPIQLTVNRRQQHAWERLALDALRTGDVAQALDAFDHAGRITVCDTADQTLQRMVDDWWAASDPLDPTAHGVMLTLRRNDVDQLNARARHHLQQAGRLGADTVPGTDGREFAAGDAVVCTANAPALRLFNGLRGQLTAVHPDTGAATLRLPGGLQRHLPASYLREGKAAHAYALTGHKAQGLDVPRAWVLGSDLLYREWAYTALSRHQQSVQLYLTGDPDPPDWVEHPITLAADPRTPLQQLTATASISRAQHLALDQTTDPATRADPSPDAPQRLKELLAAALEQTQRDRNPETDDLTACLQAVETNPDLDLVVRRSVAADLDLTI